jgi:hypothetical protein
LAWRAGSGDVPDLYADDVMVLAAATDAVGVFEMEVHVRAFHIAVTIFS